MGHCMLYGGNYVFFLSFFSSHMLNKQIKKKLHNERTITDNRHDIIVMLAANE